jgi:hypothetical protein
MKFVEAIISLSSLQIFVFFTISGALWYLLYAVNYIYFCSTAGVPVPNIIASVSIWWKIWHDLKGDMDVKVLELHKKHGPFVHISYKEVSVHHPDAVQAVLVAPLPKARSWISL